MVESAFRKLVAESLALHGLERDWSFKWLKSSAFRTYGKCVYGPKLIKLNRDFVRLASDAEVIDVLLHEIAHAITFIRYANTVRGHGPEWKRCCVAIGAKPEQYYKGECKLAGVAKQPTYHMIIETTGEVIKHYYKRPSAKVLLGIKRRYLPSRKAATLGHLAIIKV